MADRALHRDAAAHAVAVEVRAWDFEVVEQRRHIVGEIFIAEIASDVGRATVALQFDGNDFPGLGKFADPPDPLAQSHRSEELPRRAERPSS
jgi:hypothetical protein